MEIIPVVEIVNDKAIIKGVCEREYMHAKNLLHTSSLIVPVLSYKEGRILALDKCERYISRAKALGGELPVTQLTIDIFGGHLSAALGAGTEIGSEITVEMMKDNAVKKLGGRLYEKSGGRVTVSGEKMKFVGIYRQMSIANSEYSYVFKYDIAPGEYFALYENGSGESVELPVFDILISELIQINEKYNNGLPVNCRICDGIGRILDTGSSLYKAFGFTLPEKEKNSEKELRRFELHVRCFIPSHNKGEENRVIEKSAAYFGTRRQAEDRAKEFFRQQTSALGISRLSSDASYWIEELNA